MGIGDLLRSSAAWRALKNKWPEANLHLLMLSKQAMPSTEAFISSHHLLCSATFVVVKTNSPDGQQRSLPLRGLLQEIKHRLGNVSIDLIIDFEPYGLKTAFITRKIASWKRAFSIGISQFPLRRMFYGLCAPSTQSYRSSHNLNDPMDYTERDFVALAALGIDRRGARIELKTCHQGEQWQKNNAAKFAPAIKQVVLNIGCGTPDALPKRPPLPLLVDAMAALFLSEPYALHLSGAEYEEEINDAFLELLQLKLRGLKHHISIVNWAGRLTLNELTGLIASADVMISSDSGPYHMAVALGLPTVCWFNFPTLASHHQHDDVAIVVMPSPEVFCKEVMSLPRRNLSS